MIKKLFQASSTVASAAFIVGFFSLLSRFAGVVRDRVLNELFAKGTLDVYYQSFRLPDLLFQLFVVGAISASFIPIFAKAWKDEDKEKAWKYTNNVLHAVLFLFGILCVIAILGADVFAPLLAPGFSAEKQAAVAQMTRVIFAGQLFFAGSMVFGSVLQGAKRFFIPSFAPIVYNAGIIIGAIFLTPVMGPIGLAWGVVLGSFLHAVVQLVGAFSLGYRYKPYLRFRDPELLHTLWQSTPRLLGLAVNQISFVVMSAIASGLVEGSVRNLNLTYNLNFVPIGVIAISYAIAAYPTFCERVAHKDIPGLRASFSLTIRQVLFFMIPSTILFLLLRAQLVRVVYGSDGLDWTSTIEIANALGIFALSFFAQASIYILVRVYYALDDTMTPFVMALIATAANLAFGIPLAEKFGIIGLAIAFSVSQMFQMALLWAMLRMKTDGLDEGKIAKSLLILSVAGIAAAFAGQGVKYLVVHFVTLTTFWNVLLQLSATGLAAGGLYLLIAYALKSPEMMSITIGLSRKFLRTAQPVESPDV
jgi:putative peptidoglycan lipid II flippase